MELWEKVTDFVNRSEGNYVSGEIAIREDLTGMRIYDAPIFAVGDAEDPLFGTLKEPQAIGGHFRTPKEWMPEAKSVISFFLPFSDTIKESNTPAEYEPSAEWLHGRIEGQKFLLQVSRYIAGLLEQEGEHVVIPSMSEQFWAVEMPRKDALPGEQNLSFTSNWSERHVAFVCGLGTFGLSKGLITEKGICGRFGSIVTTAELPVTKRLYKDVYEYCNMCGACMRNCPADAIDLKTGKDHLICGQLIDVTKEKYAPRYGCGKCQVSVPCMNGIPGRK